MVVFTGTEFNEFEVGQWTFYCQFKFKVWTTDPKLKIKESVNWWFKFEPRVGSSNSLNSDSGNVFFHYNFFYVRSSFCLIYFCFCCFCCFLSQFCLLTILILHHEKSFDIHYYICWGNFFIVFFISLDSFS